jgi:hypothetical protein
MLSKIAIATLAGAANAVDIGAVTAIFKSFDFSGMEMLEKLVDNAVTFNNVLDHGCWCAKLDPLSESSMLGGATPVDELDDICRRWAVARHCNDDNDGGSCCNHDGNRCQRDQSAQQYYVDHQTYLANGQTGVFNGICLDSVTSGASTLTPTECARHSCYIDFVFADEIVDWINNPENSGWTPSRVEDFDTCLLPEMMDMLKTCDLSNIESDGSVTLINTSDYKRHSGYGVRDTNYFAPGAEDGADRVENFNNLPMDHQARGAGQE